MAPEENGIAGPTAVRKRRRRGFLGPLLAVCGLAALAYLLGAAVMFFQLPTSDFLGKAFLGARSWEERNELPWRPRRVPASSLVASDPIDKPGKTFDGFTLYSRARMGASNNTQAFLVNMRRQVVHSWSIPFSKIWPDPPHLQGPIDDARVCFIDCHLYPNGDLLVVLHAMDRLANGYGLVKLDKDSKVLWSYAKHIHHDVDVGEDGTIYAIQQQQVPELPRGLKFIPAPCLVDYLVVLSPDGKLLKGPISILEAFRDSPYSLLLASLERSGKEDERPHSLTGPRFDEALLRKDTLHTNCVRVLTRKLAPHFPGFKAGQVLISMRHLDTIAVLDLDKRSVVWAARGPWQGQHDAQFLANGHLLLFDNRGLPKGSRVLEYDPRTQAFPWSYAGEGRQPFYSSERGMSQRLPNGNTLVVNSKGGEIVEVTPAREAVWNCSVGAFVTTARRYDPKQLHFLKGGERARP